MYQPIHSDFIIHWTGKKNIDDISDSGWADNHSSKTSYEATELYLKRIKDILEYGLWMVKNKEDEFIEVDNIKLNRPWVARTCFTELRLSDARAHAEKFGRLGIGFKRFFLFDRLGSPMVYYHPIRRNWFFEPLLSNFDNGQLKSYSSCFLKQMCEKSKDGTWQYNTFDESEWRIIYSDSIKESLLAKKRRDIVKLFINPKDKANKKHYDYCNALTADEKPEFLIPLDAWFSLIIYPSLQVKNKAQNDEKIRNLISDIKKKDIPGCTKDEKSNYPIEVNLDACRNF